MDFEAVNGVEQTSNIDQRLVAAVCQEMMKMFKGKNPENDYSSSSMNHAGIRYYKTSFSSYSKTQIHAHCDWIIDTGASDHMSPHLSLFHETKQLKIPFMSKCHVAL